MDIKCYNIYRTKSNLEAGYIWAPYLPIQNVSQIECHSRPLTTTEIRSRYATTMVNNRFYGNITVDGFDRLGND